MEAVGIGDGEFGVAAGGEAEVGDDALAEPVARDARAEGLDGAGDLAAGNRGQRGGLGAGPRTPSRRAASRRCTPAAATAIRTWPGPGSGSSTFSYARFSAGPKAWRRTACMGGLPLWVPDEQVSPAFNLKLA
ncbi:hypothetical protein SAV31267_053800 [Streptomyces avermitilis]|uniref:Uncharacterized protein n=1 Tax=Streptomyces avermitilis TaxID=33903 RepID=A0A4D4MWS4_STRAX|nr:hypothetical protein SAV31267_053800 [Streptomyces avermitilis]